MQERHRLCHALEGGEIREIGGPAPVEIETKPGRPTVRLSMMSTRGSRRSVFLTPAATRRIAEALEAGDETTVDTLETEATVRRRDGQTEIVVPCHFRRGSRILRADPFVDEFVGDLRVAADAVEATDAGDPEVAA